MPDSTPLATRPGAAPTPLQARAHGRVVESSFRPWRFLRGPHGQTAMPSLLRPSPKLELRPERITWPDGDFTDLAWAGEAENPRGPIAILVHGLTGDFSSKYLRGTARQLIDRGFRACLFQLRGAGPEVNRSRRFYNHGDTEDLKAIWHRLHAAEPETTLTVIGWSLGGNVVLKALAEDGAKAPIARAGAASVPFVIEPCAVRLTQGFSRLYQRYLLADLKRTLVKKHVEAGIPVPPGADLKRALAARDFFELDGAYTVPNNGYADSRDYYARASCGRFVGRVTVPTLIVQALDDPFMTPEVVPGPETLAPSVTLEVAREGGHVGFIGTGAYGQPVAWLETRLADWLAAGVARPAVDEAAVGADASYARRLRAAVAGWRRPGRAANVPARLGQAA